MVSPSTWTFYADVRFRSGKVHRIEFDVIEDRAKMSDQVLGQNIKKTLDILQMDRLVPIGALSNGVYRGFNSVFRGRKFRHGGVVGYGQLNRHYVRSFRGRATG